MHITDVTLTVVVVPALQATKLRAQLYHLSAHWTIFSLNAYHRDWLAKIAAPNRIYATSLVVALATSINAAKGHFSYLTTTLTLLTSVLLPHRQSANHLPFRFILKLAVLPLSLPHLKIIPFHSFEVVLLALVKNSCDFLLQDTLPLTAPTLKFIFFM